jgi:rhodanese-related sulfurtransferase
MDMPLKTITPEQLMQKMQRKEQLVVLDVRDQEKYNNFHIEGDNIQSINIHKKEIFGLEENKEKELPALPRGSEIIVTCTTGNSATKCATILAEQDYDVAVLEGGLTAWKEYLKMGNQKEK